MIGENCYSVYMHMTPDGRRYIGQSRQKNVRMRWCEGYSHNQYFKAAIEQYGWGAITSEILYAGLTDEEADAIEHLLIFMYQSFHRDFGYNIEGGGKSGRARTKETKAKISAASKQHWQNEEYRRRCTEAQKGKTLSAEQRASISARMRGKPKSEETRKKLSEANKKRMADPARRKAVSDKHKELWSDPEYRAKMMSARKRKAEGN